MAFVAFCYKTPQLNFNDKLCIYILALPPNETIPLKIILSESLDHNIPNKPLNPTVSTVPTDLQSIF